MGARSFGVVHDDVEVAVAQVLHGPDQLMPGLKGTELIREARRIAPGLRAVLCTGNAEMSEAEALALGADAVIYKPVDIQAVDRAIGGAPPA